MNTRFDLFKVTPGAFKAMSGLEQYIQSLALDPRQVELIQIRASQLNGCAYCLNLHAQKARNAGETEQRLYLISIWRDSGTLFTEKEQLLLELTEAITLIHQEGLSDELYQKAIAVLGEHMTAQVIMVITTINAWNRIGVSLKLQPEYTQSSEK